MNYTKGCLEIVCESNRRGYLVCRCKCGNVVHRTKRQLDEKYEKCGVKCTLDKRNTLTYTISTGNRESELVWKASCTCGKVFYLTNSKVLVD